jgi:methylated-DNA-protein-cysteine methyltransferase-like protein
VNVPPDFQERLYALIRRIPYGQVATYGDLALYCGMPRGARQVGWAVSAAPPEEEIPWWRVVNRLGVPKHANGPQQADLLREEGIMVWDDGSFSVDRYRWEGPEEPLAPSG